MFLPLQNGSYKSMFLILGKGARIVGIEEGGYGTRHCRNSKWDGEHLALYRNICRKLGMDFFFVAFSHEIWDPVMNPQSRFHGRS